MIMYMLLSGGKHPLYENKDTSDIFLEKLKDPVWNFEDFFTSTAQNLFLRLVHPDPLIRYTAEDAEKHSWLTRKSDKEVHLTTHEVMTSFSLEQSFTRVYTKQNICYKAN